VPGVEEDIMVSMGFMLVVLALLLFGLIVVALVAFVATLFFVRGRPI
jgi:hypothetical protein